MRDMLYPQDNRVFRNSTQVPDRQYKLLEHNPIPVDNRSDVCTATLFQAESSHPAE